MQAEIIAIGDELLNGRTPDTNSPYLGLLLARLGIGVSRISCLGDDPALIGETVKAALRRSPLVITTGGLGPTEDDVTLRAVSRALGKKLVLRKDILRKIRSRFERRGLPMPAAAARQALVPDKALVFANPIGTAPGIILPAGRKAVILLPGPPPELNALMERHIVPYLRKLSPGKKKMLTRLIKTAGVPESVIQERIRPVIEPQKDVRIGSYPARGEVTLELRCHLDDRKRTRRIISSLTRKIKAVLGDCVYGFDNESLETALARLLLRHRKTLAVAESATGGLIGHRLTGVPGSSRYFMGGIIAYGNTAKIRLLGVAEKLIKTHGAVSPEVATAMAAGVRKSFRADFGIGITGICGPGGGSRKKPVGLVYVALVGAGRKKCEKFRFVGERPEIKFRMSQAALNLLRKELINE